MGTTMSLSRAALLSCAIVKRQHAEQDAEKQTSTRMSSTRLSLWVITTVFVGVSTNIIEASWQALTEAMGYGLTEVVPLQILASNDSRHNGKIS